MIFSSPEYRQGLVQGYYRDFLGRDADAGGMSTWLNLLRQGGRDDQVIAAIVESDEYFSRF
jgi:hypothetical protein